MLYDENQQLREDMSFKPLKEVFSEPRTKNFIFTCVDSRQQYIKNVINKKEIPSSEQEYNYPTFEDIAFIDGSFASEFEHATSPPVIKDFDFMAA